MLSPAVEDYIKIIFGLQEESPTVSTTDIARAMSVAPASATGMIKRLARMKLVLHEAYKGVQLTEDGEKIALEIIRHHRLLETYLREVLGYSWEPMHQEAEQLEHHISEEFERRIDAILGYPTHDPHGHPIPTPDLKITRTESFPLGQAALDQSYIVRHVSDYDVARLHFLEWLGLLPGRSVCLTATGGDSDQFTVSIGGTEHTIPQDVAYSVYVAAAN